MGGLQATLSQGSKRCKNRSQASREGIRKAKACLQLNRGDRFLPAILSVQAVGFTSLIPICCSARALLTVLQETKLHFFLFFPSLHWFLPSSSLPFIQCCAFPGPCLMKFPSQLGCLTAEQLRRVLGVCANPLRQHRKATQGHTARVQSAWQWQEQLFVSRQHGWAQKPFPVRVPPHSGEQIRPKWAIWCFAMVHFCGWSNVLWRGKCLWRATFCPSFIIELLRKCVKMGVQNRSADSRTA